VSFVNRFPQESSSSRSSGSDDRAARSSRHRASASGRAPAASPYALDITGRCWRIVIASIIRKAYHRAPACARIASSRSRGKAALAGPAQTHARTRTFYAPGRIDKPDHDFTRHYAPISGSCLPGRALPRLLPSAQSRL